VKKNSVLDFTGLIGKLQELCEAFPYPIMIKEVGYGFSEAALQKIRLCPVAALDVARAGGTDWGRIEPESDRASLSRYIELGSPTAESLETAIRVLPREKAVLASGGVRSGADMAKALAMGATATGIGLPFLRWAQVSSEHAIEEVERLA
jgi:isopentenyl-diphosphate delta-isomerase